MLVKAILIQWKNQQELDSSKTYAISRYPMCIIRLCSNPV
ncbi:hypothetical protein T12_1973 [Trichinella patagoniensis]|uniref:Uncharacterized protein n=1 Tax=Trichinella patagoniensis TaxID=990121 RepID=A0A0V0V114_9BILA|nr:hypothetical protein T12_1973 [Trichinella patagoniensis]